MHSPAINMAEFMHESIEEHEGNLQEEELEFAPAARDDSLIEVEDPLQKINLLTEEDPTPTFISTLLEEPVMNEIIALLHDFKNCFAWHYHEMPGLERIGGAQVANKRRVLASQAGQKKDVYLDRTEILKRKTGAIRICVDYRNLNEASPKDEYPIPMADMLVDRDAHNQMLSFMDGNARYNQIMMAEEDIHKTTFMCPGHIGARAYNKRVKDKSFEVGEIV
ncbi:hypothetical protein L3X38_011032 [Prunus dulcis]|uniref:Transposable element protein n=1 Tax=Prunus dulcis TaxID=3755 RepID=A0AAD4WJ40_PRUDU|nr:hypothetical protein L3X38_011032 [Prunus dulcis]